MEQQRPKPAAILQNAYGRQIDQGNHGVYIQVAYYISMDDRTASLEQHMEHRVALDTSLNKYQPGCGSSVNTNPTPKDSARRMDSEKGGKVGTAGTAKDDSLTCNNCSQADHIFHNCRNYDWMKKLLQHALIGKDAQKAKSGYVRKEKNTWGVPTGQTVSEPPPKEQQVKQVIDSEGQRELESLSESDSEAGKGEGGQ